MKFLAVDTPKHADPETDRIRRTHGKAIQQLQAQPASSLRVVGTVSLPDGVEVPVKHGLGRAPAFVLLSPPRGASTTGMVAEVRSGQVDRAQILILKASGFGATVTLEVAVL